MMRFFFHNYDILKTDVDRWMKKGVTKTSCGRSGVRSCFLPLDHEKAKNKT
jgi:hypothetical protein